MKILQKCHWIWRQKKTNSHAKNGNVRIKIKLLFYCVCLYGWCGVVVAAAQLFVSFIFFILRDKKLHEKTSLGAITNKKLAECKIFPFRDVIFCTKYNFHFCSRARCPWSQLFLVVVVVAVLLLLPLSILFLLALGFRKSVASVFMASATLKSVGEKKTTRKQVLWITFGESKPQLNEVPK